MSVDIGKVWTSLRAVLDPELGMSIVDLGLVYGLEVRDATVRVTMTLTTPGCPLHGAMMGWVRQAVMLVPGVENVEVQLTFDPPWTPVRNQSLRR
jgi:metal-sulfur cluster biosynthetic enzyme